jgi:hypothetical protein
VGRELRPKRRARSARSPGASHPDSRTDGSRGVAPRHRGCSPPAACSPKSGRPAHALAGPRRGNCLRLPERRARQKGRTDTRGPRLEGLEHLLLSLGVRRHFAAVIRDQVPGHSVSSHCPQVPRSICPATLVSNVPSCARFATSTQRARLAHGGRAPARSCATLACWSPVCAPSADAGRALRGFAAADQFVRRVPARAGARYGWIAAGHAHFWSPVSVLILPMSSKVMRPRPRRMRPRSANSPRTLVAVSREVPARAATCSWVSATTGPRDGRP